MEAELGAAAEEEAAGADIQAAAGQLSEWSTAVSEWRISRGEGIGLQRRRLGVMRRADASGEEERVSLRWRPFGRARVQWLSGWAHSVAVCNRRTVKRARE